MLEVQASARTRYLKGTANQSPTMPSSVILLTYRDTMMEFVMIAYVSNLKFMGTAGLCPVSCC